MLLNPGQGFIPVLGTGAFFLDSGRKLHNVRDEWVGRHLRADLDEVCEGDDWIAAVAFRDGKVAVVPRRPRMDPLPRDRMEKMVEVAALANREIHHGGHWVTAFSDGVLTAVWRDWAGDMQFENTFPETWERIKARSPVSWVDTLDAVYDEAVKRLANVVDPHKQIFRALGERSKRRPG